MTVSQWQLDAQAAYGGDLPADVRFDETGNTVIVTISGADIHLRRHVGQAIRATAPWPWTDEAETDDAISLTFTSPASEATCARPSVTNRRSKTSNRSQSHGRDFR